MENFIRVIDAKTSATVFDGRANEFLCDNEDDDVAEAVMMAIAKRSTVRIGGGAAPEFKIIPR